MLITLRDFAAKILLTFLSRIDRRAYATFIERLCFFGNKDPLIKDFVTIVVRPKNNYQKMVALDSATEDVAILIQGPIVRECDFTINTIKLYKEYFPRSPVVFSTLDHLTQIEKDNISALGVTIIICNKPVVTGFLNFNLQRETVLKGLNAVNKLGVTKVIKTRSDQRIYSRFAISFLNASLIQFPSKNTTACKGRIFLLSTTTLANFPLHVCDMFQFGYLQDVVNFWSIPAHEESVNRESFASKMANKILVREALIQKTTIPEVSLGRSYATMLYGEQSIGDPSLTYHRMLQEVIGVVDQGQLDLCWPKYNSFEVSQDYRVPWILERLTFEKWVALYAGHAKKVISFNPDALI